MKGCVRAEEDEKGHTGRVAQTNTGSIVLWLISQHDVVLKAIPVGQQLFYEGSIDNRGVVIRMP